MVRVEYPYLNETLCRHYSDKNKKIQQVETGFIYDEAVDLYPCKFTYIETTINIPQYDNDGNIIEPPKEDNSILSENEIQLLNTQVLVLSLQEQILDMQLKSGDINV